MLITKIKKKEDIDLLVALTPFVIKCYGCKEVYFPEEEINEFLSENRERISGIVRLDYLCNEDFSKEYMEKYKNDIENSKSILVFSCGVGVGVISKIISQILLLGEEERYVFTGCDTSYVNGFQGLDIQPSDCRQCGECYLNSTGGICPITACAKYLLNGPCGGYKNGKCEVNPQMECGWVRIYNRLKEQKRAIEIATECKIRNYQRYITGK
ncbi:hypothetical protein B9J78_01715 [bacterium Unc6]|nr:hypothetical protein [bacterium Unc6]